MLESELCNVVCMVVFCLLTGGKRHAFGFDCLVNFRRRANNIVCEDSVFGLLLFLPRHVCRKIRNYNQVGTYLASVTVRQRCTRSRSQRADRTALEGRSVMLREIRIIVRELMSKQRRRHLLDTNSFIKFDLLWAKADLNITSMHMRSHR